MDLTNNLRLEVQMARNDAFVWNVSTWTGSRWAGPADTATSGVEWKDILGPSHDIKIKRGAKRDGLSLSLEAGLLSVSVYDSSVDPNTNPYIKMGTPIRLVYNNGTADTSVFTGVIKTVKVTYKNKKPQVFITAVDRVKDIANINRSGVVAGTFSARVKDLLGKHGIPYVTNGGLKVTLAQNAYDSSLMNHIQLASNTEQGRFFVDKNNIVRAIGKEVLDWNYMAKNQLLSNPTWEDTNADGIGDGWTAYSANTGNITGGNRYVSTSGVIGQRLTADQITGSVSFAKWGVQQTFDLQPGKTYTFSVYRSMSGTNGEFRMWVDRWDGAAWVGFRSGTWSGNGRSMLTLPLDATTNRIRILLWIQNNGTTATDVWCNIQQPLLEEGSTAGVFTNTPAITFTDQQASASTDVEYTDIQVAYDSEAMSNDIYVENLTESAGQSVHTKYGPYQNVTSIVTYGAYREDILTNFSSQAQVDAFATAVLAEHDAPELRVDRVRFNAKDYQSKAAALDIFDTVNVDYSNESFHIGEDFHVLDIEHTITAGAFDHSWIVDVGLIQIGGA